MKLVKILSAAALGLSLAAGSVAQAETVIKLQSVLGDSSDEVVMLKAFADDVSELTGGSVTIEVMPAGAVVGPRDIIDAVDAGLVDAGFAWTHYWAGKHVAANLFGAPVAGAGVGMDNIAFLSWFQFGGGKELYDRLWGEMGVNVKGFMLQPVGPEALGWFPEPIASMDDFRKMRFRAPPGMVPALEKGTIDAAEWCCPKPDSVFGFQKVLKHYYLQGLHQVVVNADMYLNLDVYNGLTDVEKKALEVAANASLCLTVSMKTVKH